MIAVFCSIAWRIFWMTMANRTQKAAEAQTALTDAEMQILDLVVDDINAACEFSTG